MVKIVALRLKPNVFSKYRKFEPLNFSLVVVISTNPSPRPHSSMIGIHSLPIDAGIACKTPVLPILLIKQRAVGFSVVAKTNP
jgi:hypothetical protein